MHTRFCAAWKLPHGEGKQNKPQVELSPPLCLLLAIPVTTHPLLQEGFPVLAEQCPGLFQSFFAENPWEELPVGHTAQLAPSLLPGHLIHPLPTLPQAAPARPGQNLREHFSAQHPLTLGASSLCLYFFSLISLCSVAVTSTVFAGAG